MGNMELDEVNVEFKLDPQVTSILDTLLQIQATDESETKELVDAEKGERDEGKGKDDGKFKRELDKYAKIKDMLVGMEDTIADISEAKEQIDTEATGRAAIVTRVDRKLAQARKHSKAVKSRLVGPGSLKEDNIKFKAEMEEKGIEGSIQVTIRENIYNYYMRRYFLTHKQYTNLASVFKDKVHNRAKRELIILSPELTDAKADELIEKGKDREFIEQQMNGEEQELDRLLAQSDEVRQIKEGVKELLEMMSDMEALVDAQQETVDSIVANISTAKGYTGEAAHELLEAAEYQLSARKKMCIVGSIIFVVVAVILVIVLSSTGAFKKDGN